MKTIYYYQTFIGLDKLLTHLPDIDIINVSSIHFDQSKEGEKNIYLNDNLPYDPKFNQLWEQVEQANAEGVTIMLMVGGAGGAYTNLFKDFQTYYPMLKKLLIDKSFISVIDIDIEESVSLDNVKMFMNQLKLDFPDILLSMAPVSEAMETNNPGLGGFSYKELYRSEEGQFINWFNVQCYQDFSFHTYDGIIMNGYPPEKINMGMLSGQFNQNNFSNALEEIKKILEKYPNSGGVFDWEYLNAPPNKNDPSDWCRLIKQIDMIFFEKCGNIILE